MNQGFDEKERSLRVQSALNAGGAAVTDPLFCDSEFFDARDLVLVKYEMLRRVRVDKMPVVKAAATFGFSRSGFYKTLTAWERSGVVGLLPMRPGPRGASKLTDDVLAYLDQQIAVTGPLRASDLAARLREERGIRVHPRSIERALARRKKRVR